MPDQLKVPGCDATIRRRGQGPDGYLGAVGDKPRICVAASSQHPDPEMGKRCTNGRAPPSGRGRAGQGGFAAKPRDTQPALAAPRRTVPGEGFWRLLRTGTYCGATRLRQHALQTAKTASLPDGSGRANVAPRQPRRGPRSPKNACRRKRLSAPGTERRGDAAGPRTGNALAPVGLWRRNGLWLGQGWDLNLGAAVAVWRAPKPLRGAGDPLIIADGARPDPLQKDDATLRSTGMLGRRGWCRSCRFERRVSAPSVSAGRPPTSKPAAWGGGETNGYRRWAASLLRCLAASPPSRFSRSCLAPARGGDVAGVTPTTARRSAPVPSASVLPDARRGRAALT